MERVFDFSKPRVRLNGRALTKFDVAYEVERLAPANSAYSLMTILMDVLSYDEVAAKLKELLEVKL